jgi:hypothetical protein
MFAPEHLAKFKECFSGPLYFASGNTREGRGPATWFKNVVGHNSQIVIGELPPAVNRQMLLQMARKPTVKTLDLCISIFAWGGMHGNNCKKLFERSPDTWITLADRVRNSEITRAVAYDAFADLRTHGKTSAIAGMGPAYFTKLLYFLPPEGAKGYIMDQWLGCSINLLTARNVVKLDHQISWKMKRRLPTVQIDSFVSKINAGADYEAFCRTVEALSDVLGPPWTPELTERALIADGGRRPHPWRDYVVKQRFDSFNTHQL